LAESHGNDSNQAATPQLSAEVDVGEHLVAVQMARNMLGRVNTAKDQNKIKQICFE